MAKWMGFCISEHSSSLAKMKDITSMSTSIEDDEIYIQALRDDDIYELI